MKRIYDELLLDKLTSKRLLIVKGPKYSNKSSYISSLIETFSKVQVFDCEDKKTKQLLENISQEELLELCNTPFILFKEAQSLSFIQKLVENLLFESKNNCSIVLTSSYDPLLMEELVEALKLENAIVTIYPPLFQEIANHVGLVQLDQSIDQRLVFGNYTSVLESENPNEILNDIIDKTIFTHLNPNERINKGTNLRKMLQYIAFKLGEPLSYNEIAFYAELDNETVERYIHLLTKSFVLIKLPTLFNDNKYELKKTHCFYFFDNGVRNALINNLNAIDLRIDTQILWKNWLIAERIKWNDFLGNDVTYTFWRTHTKQNIDLIEDKKGFQIAYQMLWDKRKNAKFPKSFQEYYPDIPNHTINKSTYWSFLTKKN